MPTTTEIVQRACAAAEAADATGEQIRAQNQQLFELQEELLSYPKAARWNMKPKMTLVENEIK